MGNCCCVDDTYQHVQNMNKDINKPNEKKYTKHRQYKFYPKTFQLFPPLII